MLGNPRIRGDAISRSALLEAPEDFEFALETVRANHPDRAAVMEATLHDVFVEQDRAQNGNQFESRSFNAEHLTRFLDRFRDEDGTSLLFTLNQDALLERKYRPAGGLLAPGVGNVAFRAGSDPLMDEHQRVVEVDALAPIAKGEANYIKLHGSFTWRSADGNSLVVAGGKKEAQIKDKFPLLDRYLMHFAESCGPDTWLVVAGYRFRDEHINAWIGGRAHSGLRLAIFDTRPATELREEPAFRAYPELWNALSSYCSIPLARVFGGHPLVDDIIRSSTGG